MHILLIVLCQASVTTQFSVMMFFFWSSQVSKDWVHQMDILDDACSFMITLIYIYLFSQYFMTERRLMKIYGRGIRDNPMLRYKTQNGPITSSMGLIGLTHA